LAIASYAKPQHSPETACDSASNKPLRLYAAAAPPAIKAPAPLSG